MCFLRRHLLTLRPLGGLVRALHHDERGSILILVALSASVMLAFVGLGTDVALFYSQRQAMQNAADAAAMAAARAYADGNTNGYVAEARGNAAAIGFVNGQKGTVVTITMPPTQGTYSGVAGYVEAKVSQPVATVFMGAVMSLLSHATAASSYTVQATAVASTSTGGTGKYCVLGLDSSADQTVYLDNNATLPNAQCGVASNSTSATGLYLSNNAKISGPVSVAASDYHTSNNAEIDDEISKGQTMDDPYANVTPDTAPACTAQTSSGKNNVTVNLSPGHFCSGLNFDNNAVVNMSAGTYYIDSQFVFKNNATLNATTGVTIVINGTYAIDVGNNGILNITAPTSGTLKGMAIMGPRNGSSSTDQVFSNNTTLNIKGAIYFPSEKVSLENNASSDAKGCVQLIADKVYFSNNASLPNNCSGGSTTPIGPTATFKLVQ